MVRFEPPAQQQGLPEPLIGPAQRQRRAALADVLRASAPQALTSNGQGMAVLGMSAAGGLIDAINTRREESAAQERAKATAQALTGAVGSVLPQGVTPQQFLGLAMANPDIASKIAQAAIEQKLKPQERWDDMRLADGRMAQRSSVTGELRPLPEGRAPQVVAPGSTVLGPNNQPVYTAPNRPELLTPEEEAQKIRIGKETRPQNNVSVNTAANPIVQGFGEQFVKQRESAAAAVSMIRSFHEARKALDTQGGAFLGFGAEGKLNLAKLGQVFGISDPEKIANTEVFRSAIGQSVLNSAKALGANPTNTDRDYIEKVQAGQIALDEKSIRRIMDIQEGFARQSIQSFNNTSKTVMDAMAKNPNVDPTAMDITRALGTVNEPEPYKPPPQPTFEDVEAAIQRRQQMLQQQQQVLPPQVQ